MFFVPASVLPLERASALNDANEHRDNREYQQDVKKAAQGVRGNQPQQPKYEENESKGQEHRSNCDYKMVIGASAGNVGR
jgi:hypothetical protein